MVAQAFLPVQNAAQARMPNGTYFRLVVREWIAMAVANAHLGPEGATENSQGWSERSERNPWIGRRQKVAYSRAPQGRKTLPPLRGSKLWQDVQGLTPLAIFGGPFGAVNSSVPVK